MPNYTAKAVIQAPADEVFAFVSDVNRMPDYLPTVEEAKPQGAGRVWMRGSVDGRQYESDGWLEADARAKAMRWGSDGENRYTGNLQVQDRGQECYVTVTLDFEPRADQEEEFERRMGSRDAAIQDGLERALDSIKRICEGAGVRAGKRGYAG